MRDRKLGAGGSRGFIPRALPRALAGAAAGIVLALTGCGDLSLVDALKGDSPGDFQLSPDSLNLPAGSQYSFTAVGGIAPYYFISASAGLLEKQTWTYTAPSAITDPQQGWDLVTITATDLAGSSDTATVRVFPAFELSGGASLTLTLGDPAHRFSVSGGVAPYTWLVDEIEVAAVPPGTKECDFVPAVAGIFLLAVHDSIGNYREAAITVVESSGVPLAVDPTEATVQVSGTVDFTAFGGQGPSTYAWEPAGVIVPTGPKSARLTAPDTAGEVIVTLRSGSWEPVTARVVVTNDPPPEPLVLLPDAPVVDAVGDIVQFSVSGGTPPFLYSLKNQYKNWATIAADGLYTHLKSGKNVIVTVQDSSVPSLSASTTVYWQQ